MFPNHILPLEFDPKLNDLGNDKKLTDGVSAIVRIGDYLWLAHDETVRLERLSLHKIEETGLYHAKDHEKFDRRRFLRDRSGYPDGCGKCVADQAAGGSPSPAWLAESISTQGVLR
jgi:hypothetical protein